MMAMESIVFIHRDPTEHHDDPIALAFLLCVGSTSREAPELREEWPVFGCLIRAEKRLGATAGDQVPLLVPLLAGYLCSRRPYFKKTKADSLCDRMGRILSG